MPDAFPQRIVCLTEEPTEVLYAIGEADRIVGISGFTVRPARARREKPKVSAFTSARIDDIVRLEPDFVIGFSDIQADIAQALIKRGIEVWISNHRSVAGILAYVRRLGAMVGAWERSERYAGELEAHIAQVRAAALGLPIGRASTSRSGTNRRSVRSAGYRSSSTSPVAPTSSPSGRRAALPKAASSPIHRRFCAADRISSSARGAARSFDRNAWRRERAGQTFPRCEMESSTRSSRPSSCSRGLRRSPMG